jgi:acyl carrier protein
MPVLMQNRIMGESPGIIDERILAAIAAVKNVDRWAIGGLSTLDELGFDSLDRITLLFELERAYQVSVPDDVARSIRTVKDIADGLEQLTAPGEAKPAEPRR